MVVAQNFGHVDTRMVEHPLWPPQPRACATRPSELGLRGLVWSPWIMLNPLKVRNIIEDFF